MTRTWGEEAEAIAAYCGRSQEPAAPTDEYMVRTGAVRPLLRVGTSFAGGLTPRQKRRGNRARSARAWGRMMQEMKRMDLTMEEYIKGLSNEELARGQIKAADGTFRGRPPAWVPRDFHRECLRELMRRGRELWQINYVDAIRVMTDIAAGKVKGATPSERLRAAQYVVERMEGKIPERVEVQVDAPWQEAIAGIVADVTDDQIAAARRVLAAAERVPEGDDDPVDAELVDEDTPRRRATTRRRR